ncbi:MAG TPA: adenylate/guanylate cyclase domain-containing protein [Actinomycetota bacterium]|nr:adenylate/guanylate cyclase domain-containing protein [Actinomycetota bacterium]
MTIRVVLGDDNVLVREGVRALLGATDGIDVVGVAEDAPTLLAAVDEFRPDVVVTDIKMPPNFQLEGIECAHEIRQKLPGTGVVVLSAHDDEAYALALLGGGDHGLAYLLKDRLGQGDELARAIREVASGGSVIDPTIAARLSGSQERPDVDRTILDLMAKGLGYAELARELGTSQEAIDRMVTGLFQRLAAEGNVDVFKRLHSAVVDVEASARTLRSFVPAQLAAKLASGGEVNAQEEVEVTVLFSDIRGFSTLAEQLSAREVAGILARHLSAMAGVVLEYGGTIDKFAGDGVMAIFGAPDPVPDHAALALRCALAMQARQRQLNWETWTEGLPQLGIGIGVNTGTVIAGTVGGAGRLEYTVLGDAVNLAQRLQAEARANEILATAATVKAAPGLPAEPIGSRQVKGRKEPVETFRITISEEASEPPLPG